jgi:hypothetical protein
MPEKSVLDIATSVAFWSSIDAPEAQLSRPLN